MHPTGLSNKLFNLRTTSKGNNERKRRGRLEGLCVGGRGVMKKIEVTEEMREAVKPKDYLVWGKPGYDSGFMPYSPLISIETIGQARFFLEHTLFKVLGEDAEAFVLYNGEIIEAYKT
jgi:hypothetical protein